MIGSHARSPRSARAAFTLLELLIVLAILGLLAAMVVPKLGHKVQDAQVGTTEVQIASLVTSLERFSIDVGRYPTADEGLAALITRPAAIPDTSWDGPYVTKRTLPTDGWKRPFIYEINNGVFVIRSLGADGAVGGEGVDADLSSDT